MRKSGVRFHFVVAVMFREAEVDGSVCDRRSAQRSHEVTKVNEMLQGMERYNGIFICTTNLMDSLDQAALRRCQLRNS